MPVRQVQTDSIPSAEAAPLPEALTTGSTSDGNVKADDLHPSIDLKAGENGSDERVSSMGDDWVNLSLNSPTQHW